MTKNFGFPTTQDHYEKNSVPNSAESFVFVFEFVTLRNESGKKYLVGIIEEVRH